MITFPFRGTHFEVSLLYVLVSVKKKDQFRSLEFDAQHDQILREKLYIPFRTYREPLPLCT